MLYSNRRAGNCPFQLRLITTENPGLQDKIGLAFPHFSIGPGLIRKLSCAFPNRVFILRRIFYGPYQTFFRLATQT
jgi:hypothetical protein